MLRRFILALATLALLIGGLVAIRSLGWFSFDRTVNPLGLDLSAPDALLTTQSLAALPRDLLQQPIAKLIFTEDLAFYYETHEDRLGVLGAIRRIAYEHEASWSDALLRRILDEPAQVAFWRDGKGALRHYMITIKRSALTRLAEEAGKIALKDTQLTRAGDLSIGLSKVPLFALEISPRRSFLIAARGERLVLLSDPGMLLRKDKSIDRSAAAVIAQLLDAAGEPFGAALFAERNTGRDTGQVGVPVASAPGGARHRLAVNAQTVAFGYQKYFPAFEALQFALDDRGNMSGELLLDPSKTHANAFDSGRLLQSLPPQPALCAILPVSWQSAANLANKSEVTRQELGPWLLDQAQGPVGTCWYPESPLHSPVFSATLNAPSGLTDGALKSLTNWALRPSGSASLLRSDQLLVFSPDPKLADRVLAVNARRLASVADTTAMLAGQGPTVVVVTPRSLAQLIRDETSKSLAADTEPHLRAAAQRLFWPRLDALAKLPAFKISLASDALQGARGWRTLYWHNLEAR